MPYIKNEEREKYLKHINKLAKKVNAYADENATSRAGQLNYIISKLLLETYREFLPNYTDFNEIIGILECAKLEMYRKMTAPYEDVKEQENGCV